MAKNSPATGLANRNTKAFQTVRKHGREAALAGRSIASCPYSESQRGTSFNNKWRAEWMKGFASVPQPAAGTPP